MSNTIRDLYIIPIQGDIPREDMKVHINNRHFFIDYLTDALQKRDGQAVKILFIDSSGNQTALVKRTDGLLVISHQAVDEPIIVKG